MNNPYLLRQTAAMHVLKKMTKESKMQNYHLKAIAIMFNIPGFRQAARFYRQA
jgi:hypothetical protein